MKDSIFQLLKSTYSSLGLGDALLQSLADTLTATGLVTEENKQQVVEAQRAYLEAVQKGNDKRVSEALAKAKADNDKLLADAAKQAEEARAAIQKQMDEEVKKAQTRNTELQKQFDEALAKLGATPTNVQQTPVQQTPLTTPNAAQQTQQTATPKNDDIPGWYKAIMEAERTKAEILAKQQAADVEEERKRKEAEALKREEERKAFEAKMQESSDAIKKLLDGVKTLQERNEAYEREKELTRRNNFIASKVKELGIPDWRAAEGFTIAPDATDDAISSYLGVVANNIKRQLLPEKGVGAPLDDNGSTPKEVIDKLAGSIVNKL